MKKKHLSLLFSRTRYATTTDDDDNSNDDHNNNKINNNHSGHTFSHSLILRLWE